MNPEDIGKILDEIGERIGPAGEYAWTLLVTGERVTGIVGVIIGLVLAVVAYGFYRAARWAYAKHENAGTYDSHDIGMLVFGMGALLAGIGSLIQVGISLPSIVIPEYQVLRDVLGAIR